MIRPISHWFILSSALMAASSAAAASTPAGTRIENQATATFDPLTPGGVTQATSNQVVTTVQGVCAVSITPSGPTRAFLMGGDQASFGFTITNAGNQPYAFPVELSSRGLVPSPSVALYLDANGNNQLDSGEAPVSSLNLPAGGSANVMAVVKVPPNSRGEGLIQLVTSCGASGGQASAAAQVRVAPPPTLEVQKSFSPALVRPGTDTTVTVTTTNTASYASREVILTDPLAAAHAQGLVFVPGSARTNVGVIEYTADGGTWSTGMPAVVSGLRVRVAALEPGKSITLTFRAHAEEKADGKSIPNVATATVGGASSVATAVADVRYQPGVVLGPVGTPHAAEGTPADTQTRAFAVVNREICFDHTLLNSGDVKDNFRITVSYPSGSATSTLYGADGQALAQPLRLNPGESTLVRVCYTVTEAKPLKALVTVTGERGSSNTTQDVISDVQSGLPELKKTYAATTRGENGQPRPLADGTNVMVGDTVTYTLSVKNPYTRPLTNVQVSDPLPAHVDFGRASDGGVVSGAAGEQVVGWSLGALAPGETRTLTIVTTVSDRAVDGESLKNIFNVVTTELPDRLTSNPVDTPVWTAQLIIVKEVSAKTVMYGDKVRYTLKIRNASATTAIEDAVVTDVPARGLRYLPGTALLGDQTLSDPISENGTLKWKVGTIPAGGEISVSYDMRVAPEAAGDLVNVATVAGVGAGGAAKAVASNRAQATTKLDPLKFAPLADVIGTVFVDRNRNGRYDAGLDTPVERARVILAGGRLALTDTAGRYHFSNVPYGTWALRLDPNTTPYPPLTLAQDGGLNGTQTVHMRGLTSVDFPLAPLGGDIAVQRRTTLVMGDVTVEKTVSAVPGGYAVRLRIISPRSLADFELTDPLPGGAALKEGRNTLSTPLGAGETTLTYRFDWPGDPNAATTDPVIRWRY